MFKPIHQYGVALITVLMLLVFLSTLAIYAAEDQNLAIRKVSNMRESEQAFQIATGGEQWALKLLEKDMSNDVLPSNPDYDHLTELWANLGPAVKIEGTESYMQVVVFDEHAKFNLNNLNVGKPAPPRQTGSSGSGAPPVVIPNWYGIFEALLLSLDLDPGLADVVIDWIDEDGEITGSTGAEDPYYSRQKTPRLASNSQLVTLSELSELRGFTPEVIQALGPYVSALPVAPNEFTRINVNTAPLEILAALAANPSASPSEFIPLIQHRLLTPFTTVSEFLGAYANNISDPLDPKMEALLDTKSIYFISRSCAESGRVKLSQISLLQKDRNNQKVTVQYRQSDYGCPDLTPAVDSET